jgi:nitroimidazol reductase NimA-like FMN-containing flavoprotein (pyridoxamine 5'-phosphate oxidase superfamily)
LPDYHMRKKEREIKKTGDLVDILRDGKYTTVAMCRNDEPYVVTLSYGFDEAENILYFHCAQKGLKLEFLNDNPEVCATVIQDKGYKKGKCAHAYRSVVFWGKMTVVDDLEEKNMVWTSC